MSRKKIMIVDDSEIVLELTKSVLEDAGFEIVTRNTPFGTSNAIVREKPDLVLLDVSMPALSGNSIVELAKKDDALKNTKILLYSDRSTEELDGIMAKCGADGYIKKTDDDLDLVRQVNSWF